MMTTTCRRTLSGIIIGLGILAAATGFAAKSNANNPSAAQVIWRDVDNEPVALVSVDATFTFFEVLDEHGQMWTYNYFLDAVTPVSPGANPDGSSGPGIASTILYHPTADCTGPSYVLPLPSRATLGTPLRPDQVRVIPNNVAFSTINARSLFQNGACEDAGVFPTRAIRFDTLPMAKPRTGLGTPPFHPEILSDDD